MTSNYEWSAAILAQEYPNWRGIDAIIHSALAAHLPQQGRVLDVGCGRSTPLPAVSTAGPMTVGTDISFDELYHNRSLRALVVADGASLPFARDSFDVVFSKTAIEHMARPQQFFADVRAILKPGGHFIWATSNLESWPILVSRLTPLAVHKAVYGLLFGKGLAIDQFPTYYRANTERTLTRLLTATGFHRVSLHRSSWPQYFAFNRLAFRMMLPVHRLFDRLEWPVLQVHLVGVFQKAP